jgi:hypothetical protein
VVSVVRTGNALTQSGPDGKHLWFVLTDADPVTGKLVVVMLVTSRPHTDKTVVLRPGDHPFIRHESNVAYGSADFIPLSRLQSRLRSGSAKMRSDMSTELLKAVRDGLIASSRTPRYIKDYCKEKF